MLHYGRVLVGVKLPRTNSWATECVWESAHLAAIAIAQPITAWDPLELKSADNPMGNFSLITAS